MTCKNRPRNNLQYIVLSRMLSLYTTTDDADAGDHMQSIINVRQSSECVAVCQVDV